MRPVPALGAPGEVRASNRFRRGRAALRRSHLPHRPRRRPLRQRPLVEARRAGSAVAAEARRPRCAAAIGSRGAPGRRAVHLDAPAGPAGRGCGSWRHIAPPPRTPSRARRARRKPAAGRRRHGRSPRARRLSLGAVRRALPSRSTRGEACGAAGWCTGPGDRLPTDRGRRAGTRIRDRNHGRGRDIRRRYGDDLGLGARGSVGRARREGHRRRTRYRHDWRRRRRRDGRRGAGRRVRSHRRHGRCLRHRRRHGGLGGGHDCRGHTRNARDQAVGLRSNRRHQEVREHSQRESDSAPRPPTLAKCMISHDQVSAR